MYGAGGVSVGKPPTAGGAHQPEIRDFALAEAFRGMDDLQPVGRGVRGFRRELVVVAAGGAVGRPDRHESGRGQGFQARHHGVRGGPGTAPPVVERGEPVAIGGDLARARSAATLAEARAKRLAQLADEGVIAQARADEAKAEWEQARASVAQFSKMASLGGVGADGTMTLRAPIAGRVAAVAVETGGGVDTVTAPFVVEAAGAYQIELQLPERLAQAVRPGMAVEIALGGDGAKPVGGQIIAVAPSLDPATRSVMARASIGGAPGVIAGRNVTVTILGQERGIAVPDRAVTRIGDKDHVFVRKGKAWEKRAVTLAARSGGLAVIAEGLAAGEIVAGSSVAELKAMNAE